MGKYQFGTQALRAIGVQNNKAFLKDPALQEKAFLVLLSKNKWILRNEIEKYEGKIINGIEITESGILAAAHLGGVFGRVGQPNSHGRFGGGDDHGVDRHLQLGLVQEPARTPQEFERGHAGHGGGDGVHPRLGARRADWRVVIGLFLCAQNRPDFAGALDQHPRDPHLRGGGPGVFCQRRSLHRRVRL